ncbi:unnamed protein product, partial [Brassica napus]
MMRRLKPQLLWRRRRRPRQRKSWLLRKSQPRRPKSKEQETIYDLHWSHFVVLFINLYFIKILHVFLSFVWVYDDVIRYLVMLKLNIWVFY